MKTKPDKYTKSFVKKELNGMLKELKGNKDIIYKGELFEVRDYSYQRYSEWANAFKNDSNISDTIKKIDKILETRVNVGGLRKELNPIMCIFNLKNNYGWEDKSEVAVTGLKSLLDEIHDKDESIVNPKSGKEFTRKEHGTDDTKATVEDVSKSGVEAIAPILDSR